MVPGLLSFEPVHVIPLACQSRNVARYSLLCVQDPKFSMSFESRAQEHVIHDRSRVVAMWGSGGMAQARLTRIGAAPDP